MVSKRYIREDEIVGVELQKTRDSVKDVQSPTGTEKALTKDVAEQAAVDADFAKQLAEQLEVELGPLPGQVQDALDEAAAALTEAGLARSDAAAAVSAASAAASAAAQAITDAAAAANAAAAAHTTANGKSEVVRSPNPATTAGSYQQGDQWWQFDGPDIVGLWLHDGTDWEPQALTDAIISTLDAAKITTGILAADRIGALSITAAKIAAEAITTEKIAALAVTAVQLAAESVNAIHLAAGSVVTEKLAAGAVATDKLDALAVTAEKLAAGAVIADKIAAGAVVAEHIAAGAIDAMEIRGVQIYGGYIEAPTIASSDKLGSGANVLADPGFTSTVNTSWVASGFTGDAASRSQVDTITWPWETVWLQGDWAYPGGNFNHYMRNWGNVVATATLSPGSERSAGTILFPNLSWFSTTARTITAPYTFQNRSWLQTENPQGPGVQDPTFRAALAAPAPIAGTARTTYLTNSQTVAVVAGERWNAKLGFTRIPEAFLPDIAAAAVELVNASTSAVLWSHSLSAEELRAGAVNAWWDVDYTGNVKYRVKFTYTAGGSMKFIRRPAVGNYATQSTDGVETTSKWTAVATSALPYSGAPTTVASGSFLPMPVNLASKAQQVTLASASFAKVEPEKGWRLTKENGLELFSASGAKTGQLDGADNFLSGEFATAPSGSRLQLVGQEVQMIDALDAVLGKITKLNNKLRILDGSGRPRDTPISAYFQATANIGTADSNYNVGTFVPLTLAEVPSQSSYASGALSPFLPGAHMVTVLESGIYTISVRSGVPVATTGRSFIQAWAGSLYGVQEFPNGSYNFSTGMTGQLLAGQEIKFNVYQQSGGTRTCTTRLWLTYHGPAT